MFGLELSNFHDRGRMTISNRCLKLFKLLVVFSIGRLTSSPLQAMDFKREGKTGMAVTGIWPASVSPSASSLFATYHPLSYHSPGS